MTGSARIDSGVAGVLLLLFVLLLSPGGPAYCKSHHSHIPQYVSQNPMKITKLTFRKTGGFIGAFRGCDLEMGKLTAEESARLQGLIDDSKLLSLKPKTQPGACDVYYYNFFVTTSDGKEHEFKFDDVTLPESVRALARYLDGKSTDLRHPK